MKSRKYIGGGGPILFERYSLPIICNDMMLKIGFAMTGLYSGMFWAKKNTFDAMGGFVNMTAMEDVATAKKLKAYGQTRGMKYTTLKNNYLINSTRKFDDLGDWIYLKLLLQNIPAFLKALWGDKSGVDRLLDEMFYDYNDLHR